MYCQPEIPTFDILLPSEKQNKAAMTVVDAKWILKHLPQKRGAKAELAKAAGLTPKQISYILSGDRKVSQSEADAIRAHFGDTPAPAPASGFSESTAAQFSPKPNTLADKILTSLKDQAIHPAPYKNTGNDFDGIRSGDIAIIDLRHQARDGDLTVCTIADTDTGSATTHFFRLYSPWLISGSNALKTGDDDNVDIAIMGVVVAVVSGRYS